MRRRELLRSAGAAATVGVAGCASTSGTRGGRGTTTNGRGTATGTRRTTAGTTAGEFTVRSPAFENGGTIPTRYTCESENVSPPLAVSNPPEGTESFALVMVDPDAPNPPFVHWLLWNLPADVGDIPEDVPAGETVDALDGAVQGANGTGDLGYVGPCPPRGDDRHTYLFTLYALEADLDLDPGAAYRRVVDAAVWAAVARARYVGQYERPAETTTA